jgi:hypothetical protein
MLKNKAVGSSGTLVPIYKTSRHYILDDHNLHISPRKNLRVGFSGTLVPIYKTSRHYILEDHNLYISPRKNLRSNKFSLFVPNDVFHIAIELM